MADYPSVVQVYGSRKIPESGTVMDRAVNGKPRFRTFFVETQNTFIMVHDLETTDKEAIEAHYAVEKFNTFNMTFAADGLIYEVKYLNEPEYEPIAGNRWKVTARLIGV